MRRRSGELEDPDGLRLRVFPGERPGLHDVVAIGNPALYVGLVGDDAPLSFAAPTEETALIGAGITHHVAWRAADDAEQAIWLARLGEIGLRPTPVQDRKYFRSIYFRMPDGILLEIATDGPGFLVDEPPRRSARASRCRRGSSPSARRSNGSSRRSRRRRLHCRPPTRWWRNW